MNVKIVNKSRHEIPQYATIASAGMDLKANIDEPIIIEPGQRIVIPTGLYIELPIGYEAQIRPRSGIAAGRGITVLNTPGTIDADYRGEILVILINLGEIHFVVSDGMRIAQMVVARHERVEWELSDNLIVTERGTNGLGSTGK